MTEKEKMLKGLIAPFVIENGIQSLTGRYKHRKIFLDLNGNEEGQVVSTRIKADYDQGDIYSLKDLLDEHPECVDLYKSCLNKVGFISDVTRGPCGEDGPGRLVRRPRVLRTTGTRSDSGWHLPVGPGRRRWWRLGWPRFGPVGR